MTKAITDSLGNSQRQPIMIYRKGIAAGALACIATVAATAAATAQHKASREVTALVIMTPHGPATCADWMHARSPGANPNNKAAVKFWSMGYLSGLAAGSGHNIIGLFRHDALVAWMDKYCAANPQTHLELAINALGRAMVAHPGGQL